MVGIHSALGGEALASPLGSLLASPPSTARPVKGKTFLTREEALKLAFPGCEIERSTAFLDKDEQKAVAKLAGGEFKSAVVYPYRATKKGKLVGVAYFDTHRVRTLRETLMVSVAPDSSIARVELLSFAEPTDYIPRGKWYEQFKGRKLDADLSLKRKIHGVTGATLTAQSSTRCARRVLALHGFLNERAKREEAAERARKKKTKGEKLPPKPKPGAGGSSESRS